MKNIKLVFSDVDNTLVTHTNPFSDNLFQAIKLMNQNDIEFVMCSGRPTKNLINVANDLRDKGLNINYVSGFNGAQLYDLNTKTILTNKSLSTNDVILITKVLEDLSVDYLCYDQEKIYSTNLENEFAKKEELLTGLEMVKISKKNTSPKILGLVDPEFMDDILVKVQNLLPTFFVVSSTPYFIEITTNNVNKGSGLRDIAKILKIDINPYVMCCGDAGNDQAMFEICDYSIAVDNAVDSIKQLAKHVVDSAENDGVSKYIIDKLNR
ncbi:MAG: Cof-type HAD-IIB family hydrolase [Mycoplasmatales bacterium]